jgi:hypothetical protein
MIPAPIRLRALGVCLVAMSCLGGCGGDVAQAPGTHLILPDDVAARTDGAPGTDTVDVGPESDTETVCEVRDGCAPPSDVPGQDLDAGFSCTPAERTCDGATVMECATDGQGLTYVEECDDDDPCTEDQCLAGECLYEHAGACCEPPCPMGQLCFDGECVCAAQCFGKACGDDGCGGSCGECPAQHHCSPAGLCLCDPACSLPDGTGLECGDDGCGDVCGVCLGPQDACVDGLCICQPLCEGFECGSDGCGGDCGTCPAQHECSDGQCLCVPDCGGKSCGGDGCGGSCGECTGPLYICGGAQCIQDVTFAPILGVCTPHLHGGAVYYLCWEPVKWDDAKDYCSNSGAWFATITTDAEQAFLAGLAAAAGQTIWIGLKQGFWEWDSFEWVTGEGKPVTYWADGEPNDGGVFESEDCAEMGPSGLWNDQKCGAERWFFCEYSS